MSDPHDIGVTKDVLAYACDLSGAVGHITFLLGARYMGPADHIRAKHEARDYVASGDDGAARALIQHAKARRELRRNARRLD